MACGWDQCAVISDHHVTVFGTEPYNAMKVERLNGDYQAMPGSGEVSPYLAESFAEMARFFKETGRH
jgi:hypothetical protein